MVPLSVGKYIFLWKKMKFELIWKDGSSFDEVFLDDFYCEVVWESGSQAGVISPPRGHLAMSGDIFGSLS